MLVNRSAWVDKKQNHKAAKKTQNSHPISYLLGLDLLESHNIQYFKGVGFSAKISVFCTLSAIPKP